MPRDHWDDAPQYGHYEDDEEEWIPDAREESEPASSTGPQGRSEVADGYEDPSVLRIGENGSDTELETVERVMRQDGRILSQEETEIELAREQAEREDREEQERLRQLVRSGEVIFVDVDAYRAEKRRLQQLKAQRGNDERGRDA
ncbi:hypothetical protein [Segniliparus rugosus]|uniref:Uncharacterized protein n=1 Tax=Segniliparus rugosus (strain ATCC BAA-974 / DSM 45345 / CCUG 50838 / CIP 108380 / JCM 13579 / CDC 945) TaxID=679197 RepID=E5XM91_SEGRC|nr:hypothetical protein [Segniliparus rugosus]EFV14536.1 hypothetical protein HMPREF9336_00611 [Segniliparus rugosus ATCC BAA-974]